MRGIESTKKDRINEVTFWHNSLFADNFLRGFILILTPYRRSAESNHYQAELAAAN